MEISDPRTSPRDVSPVIDLNADEGPEDLILPIEVRVRNGCILLDEKYGPDWVNQIDVDTLALDNPCRCVLGQLNHGSYSRGVEAVGLPHAHRNQAWAEQAAHGFDLGPYTSGLSGYGVLTVAWKHAILARRLENQ